MMGMELRRGLRWVTTAVVLALCLAPRGWVARESSGKHLPHTDKVVHFAMFAAFALSWVASRPRASLSRSFVTSVLVASVALAVLTEVAQGHPYVQRDPDPLDALADMVGAFCAVAAWTLGVSAPRTRSVEALCTEER